MRIEKESHREDTAASRDIAEPFREAFDKAAVGMALVDLEGYPLETNPALREMLGYGPGELRGMVFTEFTHPEDATVDMSLYQGLLAGEREYYQMEKRFLKKGGGLMWGRLTVSLVRSESGFREDGSPGRPLFAVGIVEDITARKEAEEELRLRERAITATHNGIIVTDALAGDDPIVYVNRGFERITGYSAEEVVGHNARFLQSGERDQPSLDELQKAIRENREWSGMFRNYRKDGAVFWNEHNVSPVYDEEGRVVNHIGVVNDVTERKKLEDQLTHRALHDPLTNLPNRVLFVDRLGHALARGAGGRLDGQVAVLFMDLDNFKYVNDSMGHEVGDRLLVELAECIRGILRPADTVSRFGGDEFAVLLEEVSGPEEAIQVAERVADKLKTPFALGEPLQEVSMTLSVGIVVDTPEIKAASGEEGPGDLLKYADLAMYEAKRKGRARHAVYEGAMSRKAEARLALYSDLRRAIDGTEGRLQVCYQPQVSLESGLTVGLEALLRWESPERGLVMPGEFIPLAEETGLIAEIGEWVLRDVCLQVSEWRRQGFAPCPVWVNLSALQLREPGLQALVAEVIRESGLPAGSLGLEITESVLMENVAGNIARLEELKSLGVKLAIDDFGTGYSSLAYLKRLPVDYLKIDHTFVDGLGCDAADKIIVSAILGLARTMNLEVVAEGVETAQQFDELKELGCEIAQGFYFAHPMPARDISAGLPGGFRSIFDYLFTNQPATGSRDSRP